MNLNLETVENQVMEFDKMKFIDKDGKEKISGRDLAKALGYAKWQNFQSAIKRTNDQIKSSGKDDSELITEVSNELEVKNQYDKIAKRKQSDYYLTRSQAINVANNADTSKPEVAMVQEWLYDTSEVGQRAINIFNKMKDRKYIEDRSSLSIANKQLSGVCIDHGVEANQLGIVHDACDQGLYDLSTKEMKAKYGKANRPKADFLGSTMCAAETFAKDLTSLSIESQDAEGVNQCSDIAFDVNREIREQIQNRAGKNPEDLITGEDVKKVEKRYNKLTKEQIEAIEKEY